MKYDYFLSICIPSYNRPKELLRLLNSIVCSPINQSQIEIIIGEDMSPKRDEIIATFNDFMKINNSLCNFKLLLNEKNLGYDANLRNLIEKSNGQYITFMGDDDVFTENAIDKLIEFIKKNRDIGYILRAYKCKHINGAIEDFKYFNEDKFFEKGIDSLKILFRKSLFISGFTFKHDCVNGYETDMFDSTLLYQIYLVCIICLNYKSAYLNYPITMSIDSNDKIAYFGSSDNEKMLYEPKVRTIDNSINFIKSYFKITSYIDNLYGTDLTKYIKKDMSKYSYPILSFQRRNGIKYFTKYAIELKKCGLGVTIYFYIYYLALLIFNEKLCDSIIINIKNRLGYTPKL